MNKGFWQNVKSIPFYPSNNDLQSTSRALKTVLGNIRKTTVNKISMFLYSECSHSSGVNCHQLGITVYVAATFKLSLKSGSGEWNNLKGREKKMLWGVCVWGGGHRRIWAGEMRHNTKGNFFVMCFIIKIH